MVNGAIHSIPCIFSCQMVFRVQAARPPITAHRALLLLFGLVSLAAAAYGRGVLWTGHVTTVRPGCEGASTAGAGYRARFQLSHLLRWPA